MTRTRFPDWDMVSPERVGLTAKSGVQLRNPGANHTNSKAMEKAIKKMITHSNSSMRRFDA
jgi:hypothetical protein